jgi:hypothetical protein
MQKRITSKAQVTAVWAAIGGEGDAPAALTVTASKADSAPTSCACGCGTMTAGGTWAPGHDAKHKSVLYGLIRTGTPAQAKAAKAEVTKRGWPAPSAPKAKAGKGSKAPKAKAEAATPAHAEAREAAADASV